MRFPNTLLIGLAALVLWGASRVAAPPTPKTLEEVPTLAIPGSGFGSLAARTMRLSLYAYWHSGEAYQAPPATPTPPQAPAANTPPPPPPPTPGVFSRRRLGATAPADPAAQPAPAAQPPPDTAHASAAPEPASDLSANDPPLVRAASWLRSLEKRRTQRKDRAPFSPGHAHYLNAATGWRLRLAYNLDPGDPVLYEILHHHILTTSQDVAQARMRSQLVTEQALAHAHSSQAGMSDALTGLGAAINAFNETVLAAQPGKPEHAQILANWEDITLCQRSFRERRAAAEQEGWWMNIPIHRRAEIDDYAKFLDRLTGHLQVYLERSGIEVSHR
ncbi:hypothetical protein DES53_11798 [Roseimicrobium gellanilyticum]|uniref:Uncharacterized protein n=1 Tax=Roseimicrobium gellanilyticum TaxID=748857 RepID=A0A366H365_9BACT|nr:hypothetical protein [Roseimicrobium gellanilyticum]RBP36387.1 hypothetical protein DES53_11798 [Roseimicrobium gellanilyticum]